MYMHGIHRVHIESDSVRMFKLCSLYIEFMCVEHSETYTDKQTNTACSIINTVCTIGIIKTMLYNLIF